MGYNFIPRKEDGSNVVRDENGVVIKVIAEWEGIKVPWIRDGEKMIAEEKALSTLSKIKPVLADMRKQVEAADFGLGGLLECFDPICLSQMKKFALLNRTDTKYVMSVGQLHNALANLSEHYRVLEINRLRMHHYRTLYFDTQDFALYQRHHSGGRNRYKVRSREYVDSGLSFLEIKLKTNKDRTIKSRLKTKTQLNKL